MSRRASTPFRWVGFTLLAGAGLLDPLLVGVAGFDALVATVSFAASAGVGGLIIGRRDGHPTGWLLVLVGLALMYANGVAYIPGLSPFIAAWVGSWAWPVVFSLFAVLTLTFPSGHLPSGSGFWPRTAHVSVWVLPVLVAISGLTQTLSGPESTEQIDNPFGFLPDWVGIPSLLGVVAVFLGGVIALVLKRGKATGVERAQLTLVVFALVLLVASIVVTFGYIYGSIVMGYGDPGDAAWSVAYGMMILFPLSFGIAVLRYRLYDIDRIISRTVGYMLVVALLGALFFAAVTTLGSVFPAESPLAVAGSTLAVAALFNPLRRRVQEWVDQRFNRARYDAQRVMEGFAGSLQGQLDHDGVVDGWVGVVAETMQPTSVAVWVREE